MDGKMIIHAGKQITDSADRLLKIQLDYLYNSIKKPNSDIEARIRRLRIAKAIDVKRYNVMKRELPYVVCGVFNPPFRRTENFAYIEFFIIDIDNLSQKGLSVENVRADIEKDSRTVMLFASPGEDGLKVMFHLQERCYDHGIYSEFYRRFVAQFSQTYHLEQAIDGCTSDVCRACFVSYDPRIYYNPQADSVDLKAFVNIDENPMRFHGVKGGTDAPAARQQASTPADNDPDEAALLKIKEILQQRPSQADKVPAYVPQQLNDIIGDVRKYIEDTGIQVSQITNISYGKKIQLQLGLKQAEVNLFYGRRGFSVVKSPRCGTNSEFNDVAADLINCFFAQNQL